MTILPAPARRALENAAITSLVKLSTYTENEIMKLHGIGNTAIEKLRSALLQEGLHFKHW